MSTVFCLLPSSGDEACSEADVYITFQGSLHVLVIKE